MKNFVSYPLVLSLVILMAACEPTPTPIATVVSDCEWDGTAVAWLDTNNNSFWDNNESPLTNIEFYVDGWTEWYIDDAYVSKDVPAGGVGISVWLAGCPDVSFQVCAKVPEGYRPTTMVCMTPKESFGEILPFGLTK